jgi:protein phosphatase
VTLRWRAAGATHVGRVRRGNEDTLRVEESRGVFLVADGMGGHAAGEVASALAADAVAEALAAEVDRGAGLDALEAVLQRSFVAAHEAISGHPARDPATQGMGTTLTALVLQPDGEYRVGHVGDSRMYLMRDGALRQLTRDHTWVQREVDAGRLTPEAARRHHLSHILTRALGAGDPEAPDLLRGTVRPGDRLLLATDGLTGMLHDGILQAFLEERREVEKVVRMLVTAANRRGGRDNVTAIVVDVE